MQKQDGHKHQRDEDQSFLHKGVISEEASWVEETLWKSCPQTVGSCLILTPTDSPENRHEDSWMSISPLTKKSKLRLHSLDDFSAVSGAVKRCLEIGLHSNPLRELTPVNPNLACLVWYGLAKMQHDCFIISFIFPQGGGKWFIICYELIATRELK